MVYQPTPTEEDECDGETFSPNAVNQRESELQRIELFSHKREVMQNP